MQPIALGRSGVRGKALNKVNQRVTSRRFVAVNPGEQPNPDQVTTAARATQHDPRQPHFGPIQPLRLQRVHAEALRLCRERLQGAEQVIYRHARDCAESRPRWSIYACERGIIGYIRRA